MLERRKTPWISRTPRGRVEPTPQEIASEVADATIATKRMELAGDEKNNDRMTSTRHSKDNAGALFDRFPTLMVA